MTANFEIKDFRKIRLGGRLVDLHKNFDFRGFDYDLQQAQVKLHWVKGVGSWIPREELGAFTILHHDVTYFNVLLASAVQESDIQKLSEVTFFPSSNRDENQQFSNQAKPKPDDDIIYAFVGGLIIRVGCHQVSLLR